MTSETVAILVAVLSFCGTLIGNLLAQNKTQAVIEAKFDAYTKNTDEKLEDLKKQVEKHNKVIERTYALEGRMTEAEHDIRDLKAR